MPRAASIWLRHFCDFRHRCILGGVRNLIGGKSGCDVARVWCRAIDAANEMIEGEKTNERAEPAARWFLFAEARGTKETVQRMLAIFQGGKDPSKVDRRVAGVDILSVWLALLIVRSTWSVELRSESTNRKNTVRRLRKSKIT